jgi:hypothetical protein
MDDTGLFAINLDPDADPEADEVPNIPRTHQTEADFQAQKSSYSPQIDQGDLLTTLYRAVPVLDPDDTRTEKSPDDTTISPVTLTKKEIQLLGYAVGELYWDGRYEDVVRLCARVEEKCVLVGVGGEKVRGLVGRWRERCLGRLKG